MFSLCEFSLIIGADINLRKKLDSYRDSKLIDPEILKFWVVMKLQNRAVTFGYQKQNVCHANLIPTGAVDSQPNMQMNEQKKPSLYTNLAKPKTQKWVIKIVRLKRTWTAAELVMLEKAASVRHQEMSPYSTNQSLFRVVMYGSL